MAGQVKKYMLFSALTSNSNVFLKLIIISLLMFFLFLKNSILGSFVVVSVKPVKVHRDALTSFENLDFGVLETIVEGLGLPDLQFALYQCDQEGQAGVLYSGHSPTPSPHFSLPIPLEF